MYKGSLNELNGRGEFNQIQFVIRQLLGKMHIATLVEVMAVTNAGADSPVGSVDVTPLVNMLDGFGNTILHGVIYNIPYFRLQGGSNAIILDPQVGDIGLAVFCDNDVSTVKTTKAQANPASGRRNDWADGMYFGGFLNGTPTQFIEFSTGGIKITSPTQVNINGVIIDPSGNVTGPVGSTITAPTVDGSSALIVAGLSVGSHYHSDPQGGNTGGMIG